MIAVLIGVAGVLAIAGLYWWSPWVEPTEVEWLGTYESWTEGIEASLAGGFEMSRAACESTYDDEVGDPPKARLEPVSAAARDGCATLSPDGWRSAQADVVRALIGAHSELLPPRQRQEFAEIARSSVGVEPKVYCWQPAAWVEFVEQYAILRGDEKIRLKAIGDNARNRIDLDPGVCVALRGYLARTRPPPLSYHNFELAEALIALTHEAEHLKAPSASETEVECYAVQHVRPLLRAVGWDPAFAKEIALHGWEIGYTQLPPRYRMPECRDGGPLDRNPRSNEWP